jgi:hypothetical protein
METLVPEKGDERNLKFYVLAYFCCMWTGELMPSPERVLNLSITPADPGLLIDCAKRVTQKYEALAGNADKDTLARGPDLLARLRTEVRRRLAQKSRVRKPRSVKVAD